MMISFLAVCLRKVYNSCQPSEQTTNLKLCTVLMSQLSNWSLDLEMSPIELSRGQAQHLYDTGKAYLVLVARIFFVLLYLGIRVYSLE